MKKIIVSAVLILSGMAISAQKKVVLDISHESRNEYTQVNPAIFDQYADIVENKTGAKLLINEDKQVDGNLLSDADLLIILSPLKRDRETPKNNLNTIERNAIVDYVKNGGKLIFFMDEEHRVDMEAFGGNDILKPFGMEYGLDLPMKPNAGAKSISSEAIKKEYELSYSGSRSLAGGTPISYMNGDEQYVHGAYVKLDNGGTIVAFGETMTGLFMGGVEMSTPAGLTITWHGKDDPLFMHELIEWTLNN